MQVKSLYWTVRSEKEGILIVALENGIIIDWTQSEIIARNSTTSQKRQLT